MITKQHQYAEEAKQRWGHTEAYKQSNERMKKMTKEDIANLKKNGEIFTRKLASVMPFGPKSREAQELIAQHYNGLRTFYEPNLEMYRGLANMYVDDPRFRAYYDRFAKGLAVFMRDAMNYYADIQKK